MDIREQLLEMDLYTFLECDPSATTPEIKTAYKKKALLCHPDKHPDNPNAAEMFKTLKSVVDLLLDQHKRMHYDQQRAAANSRKMDSQQKAQEEFQRKQNSQQESYRRERSHGHQNEPDEASDQATETSDYTPTQLRDIEIMVAALAALNNSHRDRMREQAKRRGMGRSKRPSCFSTSVDPNCRSFWTYPRPNPTSNPDPNRPSSPPRSTFSNLDPNSPIFQPRTMPGQTL